MDFTGPLIAMAAVIVSCAHRHEQHAGGHPHTHGRGCGHPAIAHDGHTGYLHEGHLHCVHAGRVDDHVIAVNGSNPNRCTPNHGPGEHPKDHGHGPNCGHPAVPHGDHTDYLIDDHLHHKHGDHCDDHGKVDVKP